MRSGRKLFLGGAATSAALGVRLRRALRPRNPPPAQPEADVDNPPELPEEEVSELREELRQELDRLANADIKASRSRHERASPPG
jgi:hypothetical protein